MILSPYVHKDVDNKKLRKLILESKLAPCVPGDEDSCCDLEECPICFFYYPSLNRSRCCKKGICTECFLRMMNPNSTRSVQCPFCKTSNYAVEYQGVKTNEEKDLEQLVGVVCYKIISGPNRDDFDLYFEDVMVMEAIWRSIQEKRQATPAMAILCNLRLSEYTMEERQATPAMAILAESSSSPSGGLACAIAALAERQQTGGESIVHNSGTMPSFNLLPSTSSFYNRLEQGIDNYSPAQSSSNVLPDGRMIVSRDDGEWGADRGSDAAEAGTSYASSENAEDADGIFLY